MTSHILVVDDQSNMRSTIAYLLEKEGFRVTTAASGSEALTLLESHDFEFALIDVKMAQMDGLELLRRIRARWPGVAVILMTAYASIPAAVDAMKMGASHYLEKPFTKEKLLEAFEKVRSEVGGAAASTSKASAFAEIGGASQAITDAIELARRTAATDKPVLVLGEIGTGRELIARGVHQSSPRAPAPFIPVRCAALGDGADAELFGSSGSPGRLVEANGGTVFLDEVAELSNDTQAKLLRFLQDGEVPREAGTLTRSDARVTASSSEDVEKLVEDGTFRRDLYLRLKTVVIRLPALRDRRGDIPKLVQYYAKKHRSRGGAPPKFDKDAVKVLMTLPFPGNLQELEDIVEQALALSGGQDVTPALLAKMDIQPASSGGEATYAIRERIESEEKRAIEEELRKNPRNLKQTAKNLNISRTTLWRKMRKYGLDRQ